MREPIGTAILQAPEKRFPEMQGNVELLDVAAPKTFERYCNAYHGAFMPFLLCKQEKKSLTNGGNCRPAGLNGSYSCSRRSERATGVEPASRAWEARVMPLYDARSLRPTVRCPERGPGSRTGIGDRHNSANTG